MCLQKAIYSDFLTLSYMFELLALCLHTMSQKQVLRLMPIDTNLVNQHSLQEQCLSVYGLVITLVACKSQSQVVVPSIFYNEVKEENIEGIVLE